MAMKNTARHPTPTTSIYILFNFDFPVFLLDTAHIRGYIRSDKKSATQERTSVIRKRADTMDNNLSLDPDQPESPRLQNLPAVC
jgi:hypothetical protein